MKKDSVSIEVPIFGTLMDVEMSPVTAAKIAAGRQRWEAEKHLRTNKAREAIQRHHERPNHRHRKAALEAIQSSSLAENSEGRLLTVLCLIEFAPPEIFWPAVIENWNVCDATWDHRGRFLQVMKNAAKPSLAFLSPAQRQFFETLPPQVQVFRGCSAPRVRAIAWSTNRAVAEGFAHGHRGIRVPDPVVATALIPKEHIFFVTDDRNEKEVVLNPRRLCRLIIEPFEGS